MVLSVDTGTAPALEWADGDVELGARRVRRGGIPDGHRVTVGTVSATGRSSQGPRGRLIPGGIEHAALKQGSSGGPSSDADGRLLGITTLRLEDGFSIASPRNRRSRSGSTR